MEPRVRQREKRLYLRCGIHQDLNQADEYSYDVPHRVRCSSTYPIKAPNDSRVLFYGYEGGLKVLWQGGRRLKRHKHTGQHSAENEEGDMIDVDDEQTNVEYEDVGEEQESECAYSSILYSLDIKLSSPVSKIAVPANIELPAIQQDITQALLVVATLDGSVQLLRIPLEPISNDKQDYVSAAVLRNALRLKDTSSYIRCLTCKVLHDMEDKLLVAAGSDNLELWQIPLKGAAEVDSHTLVPYTGYLSSLALHSSPQSRDLVIGDKFGKVSIYQVPSDDDIDDTSSGWLVTLRTPFTSQDSQIPARTRLLDVQYVLGGRCLFALLEDGQWGIWELTDAPGSKSLEQFAFSGYLERAVASDLPEIGSQKKSRTSLTPMTPNTRKAKASDLFSSPQPKSTATIATGGLSVSRSSSIAGVSDESIMLWHNTGVYSIPSMQSFWQRSTNKSTGMGSLYAPSITRIQTLNVCNECITSLSQFNHSSVLQSSTGQMTVGQDFLVSAEYRIVVVQNVSPTPTTQALIRNVDQDDQRMLDAGELDLGGMDRMLTNMSGRSRKVGFVN